MTAPLHLIPLPGLPLVQAGDHLASLVLDGLARADVSLKPSDVLVVAQKVISKAEGRLVLLRDVEVSPEAAALAATVRKDPRLVALILAESRRVVRALPGLLIVEHRLGTIMANAGIDQSNVAPPDAAAALLLPLDPDASAARLAADLAAATGVQPAVIINDSFGRPWRHGTVGVALGAAGLPSLVDARGRSDLFGRRLEASVIGYADEIASAASLLMGQADEACPVILVRGLRWTGDATPASTILRGEAEDQFR